MANYSPRLVDKMNEIAHRYAVMMRQSLYTVLKQYSNTGEGLASLIVDVVDGDESKSPQIKIAFEDHLIFLDKRKLQWTKLPEVEKLIAWAETKEADPKKAKKLAWAVAWDKKKHDTWKRRPWRKKSLSSVLKDMNKVIIAAFDKAIEDDIAAAA